MRSRRPSEPEARPTSDHGRDAQLVRRTARVGGGTARMGGGTARMGGRVAMVGLVVAAAALLGACSSGRWNAPSSTVDLPVTTTPALTPVPGGGGSYTVTNPLAYQAQSPGRQVPSVNGVREGRASHQANHNYY